MTTITIALNKDQRNVLKASGYVVTPTGFMFDYINEPMTDIIITIMCNAYAGKSCQDMINFRNNH